MKRKAKNSEIDRRIDEIVDALSPLRKSRCEACWKSMLLNIRKSRF
ncbi:MAG: hypothetical protein LBR50_05465 [Tannerella sp.]|nr:hypothetical protein [Tannerella sp.]